MIDYLHGLVVLAYRHRIFYFDAKCHLDELVWANEKEVKIKDKLH